MNEVKKLLVTDFDGTMTSKDYYKVFCERYVPDGGLQHFEDFRAGKITHFEAMHRIFSAAAPGEAALLALTRETGLDPELPGAIQLLRRAGWDVVVVSAGCLWYIERILKDAGVEVTIHASPGRVEKGRLLMHKPVGSEYHSETAGIDKKLVVRRAMERGLITAFAGDGLLDLGPALAVTEHFRFARGDLARALSERGSRFHRFARWTDIAYHLLKRTDC